MSKPSRRASRRNRPPREERRAGSGGGADHDVQSFDVWAEERVSSEKLGRWNGDDVVGRCPECGGALSANGEFWGGDFNSEGWSLYVFCLNFVDWQNGESDVVGEWPHPVTGGEWEFHHVLKGEMFTG